MCSKCNGELVYLGTLGNLEHYRCRRCGWEESHHVGCKGCGSELAKPEEKARLMCNGCVQEIAFQDQHTTQWENVRDDAFLSQNDLYLAEKANHH